ncbi:MAG: dihydroxy-acid dehydratase [Hyphomicrobiaceae bacterium TMED74]|nr:dihydroxy-acid dehydratase [Filomicrobium sp.]RPG47815.1 MAG: dihydroxy-acid dehydratase [Hyphomicrobiaceae bacterium TMED74]
MSNGDEIERGFLRDLQSYGDRDFSIYMRRAFAKSQGWSSEELKKPVVGIAYTYSRFNPCHRHFPELLDAIKRGVAVAGGIAMEFPTTSLHESTLAPNSMKFRNLMALDTEEMIRAQPMDSVVLMGGCDKTVPAQLMGAISAGKPAIQLIGGPQMTSRYKDDRVGACTDCRKFWMKYRAGEINDQEIEAVEGRLVTTAGTCAVMGTASTMAAIAESLGMTLPGTAAIPAVHADRLRAAEASGQEAVRIAREDLTPDQIVTPQAIENALRVLLSIGGSTNGVIHLAAIAGRAGIKLDLNTLNALSDTTPVLTAVKPVGNEFYMEDFFAAGGIGAVLRELKPLLNMDCKTITGQTLGERLSGEADDYVDRRVIMAAEKPLEEQGGLVALFGSLAPDGCIIKRSAATPELFEKEGRAVVFTSLDDLAARIDDPDLDVTADDFLILQNAGPRSDYAMPEAGFLPIPKKLLAQGVKDMVRISDARMSGTAYGTIILHVAPEAAAGGPLRLVKSGDKIRLSVANKSIDLLVDQSELDKRRAALPQATDTSNFRGYDRMFRESVLQAPEGADFDFCRTV